MLFIVHLSFSHSSSWAFSPVLFGCLFNFISGCARSLLLPEGFSLVVASGGYSQVAGLGLLNAVASLVAEHRLVGSWASVVAAHRLSSCGTQA